MNLKSKILSTALTLGNNGNVNYAFDFRAFLNDAETKYLVEASTILWNKIKHLNPEILVSKGMGGLPLLTGIKMVAFNDGVDLATLAVRDARKSRGIFKRIIEGPDPKTLGTRRRTVFVDDLFNQGNTFKSIAPLLFDEGYDVDMVGVAAILDFWDYSRQLTATGFDFHSIFRRHDLGLTRVDHNLPKLFDNLSWRSHIHHNGRDFMPIKSLPVIHDGRMFVGNDNTGFYCYDVENGDLLWNIESTLPSLKGTVCVAKFLDENVFYTSYDGTVRSVNYKTGNHNWTVKADLNLHSAVEIDAENRRLFLGTEWDKRDPWYGRGDIICLNADTGRELWRTPTRGMIPASPYFSKKHNKVFCGSNDFHVYILNADTGEIVATVPTMGEVKGKIAATENEDIFVAQSITGNVHAFTVTGEILWTRNIGYDSLHPYPLVWGDSVYAANNGAHILSLDINTGTVNWLCKIRSSVGWGVTKIGEHLLAVGTNGYVAVIDRHTGEKLAIDEIYRTATVNGAVCHQPAAYDGKNLIIVTNNKGILAYKLDINDYDFN